MRKSRQVVIVFTACLYVLQVPCAPLSYGGPHASAVGPRPPGTHTYYGSAARGRAHAHTPAASSSRSHPGLPLEVGPWDAPAHFYACGWAGAPPGVGCLPLMWHAFWDLVAWHESNSHRTPYAGDTPSKTTRQPITRD